MRVVTALILVASACNFPALSASSSDAGGADSQSAAKDGKLAGEDGKPAGEDSKLADAPRPDAALVCGGADEQTDPDNCGACGHSCLGGGCSAGLCQPVTLAISNAPQGVTFDSSNVYWDNSNLGTVGDVAIDAIPTGAPPNWSQTELIATSEVFPQGIGVLPNGSAELLIWGVYSRSNAGTIEACTPSSCSSTVNTAWVPSPNLSAYISVDKLGVYWNTASGVIEACTSVSGCSSPAVVVMGGSNAAYDTPEGDGQGHIYWLTSQGSNSLQSAQPVANASVTTLVSNLSWTGGTPGILVNGGEVFWADSQGHVYSCATSGCSGGPTLVVNTSLAIAAGDSTDLYFSGYDSSTNVSTVAGCQRTSCAATMKTLLTLTSSTMPATSSTPYGTGVPGIDAKRIYLADYGNGQISWVAR